MRLKKMLRKRMDAHLAFPADNEHPSDSVANIPFVKSSTGIRGNVRKAIADFKPPSSFQAASEFAYAAARQGSRFLTKESATYDMNPVYTQTDMEKESEPKLKALNTSPIVEATLLSPDLEERALAKKMNRTFIMDDGRDIEPPCVNEGEELAL